MKMKMKTLKEVFAYSTFALALCSLSIQSKLAKSDEEGDGIGAGGGGQAVLCYKDLATKELLVNAFKSKVANADSSEIDLRLDSLSQKPVMRDLFEYGGSRGLKAKRTNLNEGEISYSSIMAKLRKSNPKFYDLLSQYFTTDSQWISAKSGVVTLKDATFAQRVPQNCLVVQVAIYDDVTGMINFDERIVDSMDDYQKDALRLHEEIYKFYRESVAQLNLHFVKYTENDGHNLNRQPWGTESEWNRPLYSLYSKAHQENKNVNRNVISVIPRITSDTVRPMVGYLMSYQNYDANEIRNLAVKIAVGVKLVGNYYNSFFGEYGTFPVYVE